MAAVDQIVVIDCSIPAGEDGHVTVRGLNNDEKRQQAIDAAAGPADFPRRRHQRNALLLASDWTQTALDAPLTDDQRAAWATYRQALRDWPDVGGDLPEPPS